MLAFIVVVDNGIMHGLLNLQYVLHNGKDVLQETKVQEFSTIFNMQENLYHAVRIIIIMDGIGLGG